MKLYRSFIYLSLTHLFDFNSFQLISGFTNKHGAVLR
nr:MAG TPA: hypothetical protein [Bacteriophage sp.]